MSNAPQPQPINPSEPEHSKQPKSLLSKAKETPSKEAEQSGEVIGKNDLETSKLLVQSTKSPIGSLTKHSPKHGSIPKSIPRRTSQQFKSKVGSLKIGGTSKSASFKMGQSVATPSSVFMQARYCGLLI